MLLIKVPATTANLGPGFDTLGAALSLYNTYEVNKSGSESLFTFEDEAWYIPDADNLVLTAMDELFQHFGRRPAGFRITQKTCEIPVARGLGSSAAAIVAGLYAGLYLIDEPFDRQFILSFASKLEGHPDNAVPAVSGGIVAAMMTEADTRYHTLPVSEALTFLVLVPDRPLETALARSVLPLSYSRQDVHNLSRVAMLIAALSSGRLDALRGCFDDRIHEPYRWHLMPDHDRLAELKEDSRILGGFISGAGSSFIALCCQGDEFNLRQLAESKMKYGDCRWRIFPLKIDSEGTLAMEVF